MEYLKEIQKSQNQFQDFARHDFPEGEGNHKSLKIALDWDDTFTSDTRFWEQFIKASNRAGHKVYIVTARSEDIPIEYIPEGIKEIIYCGFKAKKTTTELMGISIDIWIDDTPEAIIQGYI